MASDSHFRNSFRLNMSCTYRDCMKCFGETLSSLLVRCCICSIMDHLLPPSEFIVSPQPPVHSTKSRLPAQLFSASLCSSINLSVCCDAAGALWMSYPVA
eukprot:429271-Pelagomonas_calceolata.AAC.2